MVLKEIASVTNRFYPFCQKKKNQERVKLYHKQNLEEKYDKAALKSDLKDFLVISDLCST